jgi:hypothetical protein
VNPRLIRANIALFQGKRSETRRLLDEYTAEQPDARRSPIVLWLDAHSQPKQAERMSGLGTVVENVPPDDPYHRMAKSYLADEQHYAGLLDTSSQGRRIRPWQIIAGIVGVVVVLGAFVLFGQAGQPPLPEETEEAVVLVTEEATEEPPTPTPSPTAIVQNTPQVIQLSTPGANYEAQGGTVRIVGIDSAVQVVMDARGEQVQPADGAKFYAFQLQFQCILPICNTVPQAELFARINSSFPDVAASEGLFVAGEPALAGRVGLGELVTGWVVFELPRTIAPTALVVWPLPPTENEERPGPIIISLS